MAIDRQIERDIKNGYVYAQGEALRRLYLMTEFDVASRLFLLLEAGDDLIDPDVYLDEVRQMALWMSMALEHLDWWVANSPRREQVHVIANLQLADHDEMRRFYTLVKTENVSAHDEWWHEHGSLPPYDDDEERDREVASEFLQSRGLENVGLNADWSFSAYLLGPPMAHSNRSNGAYYLLDAEDGSWEIVRRWYPPTETDPRLHHDEMSEYAEEAFYLDPDNDAVEPILLMNNAYELRQGLEEFLRDPPWHP